MKLNYFKLILINKNFILTLHYTLTQHNTMANVYVAPSILNEPNFNFIDEVNEAVKSVDYSAFTGTSKEFATEVVGFVPGYSIHTLTVEQKKYLKALHNLLIAPQN